MSVRRRSVSGLGPILSVLGVCLTCPVVASAQQDEPIAPIVLDVRGALAKLDESGLTAGQLGVPSTALPRLGLGVDVGLHVYPLRWDGGALGIGASLLLSRGRDQERDSEGEAIGPEIETRLESLAPQISLNFGDRDGWSYISGGLGRSIYAVQQRGTGGTPPRVRTINYGGGARWFAKRHLAFALDLRFYAIDPQNGTSTTPAVARTTLMVFSAGVAVK